MAYALPFSVPVICTDDIEFTERVLTVKLAVREPA
jgi:hypothetical protein